jgi:hypothetical protein
MKTQKVGIFEHEDLEAEAQYYSAPVADMDRCVVIDFFFTAADGWLAEINDLHSSQCNIIRNHYLWEYPVLISGILSKEKVRSVRYFSSAIFDFNRNAEGLHRHYPIQECAVHKHTPG